MKDGASAIDTRLHRMTRVAILWHMHQPFYEDLVTREHILPWVRLHALKDYYGMVALLKEFPGVRATFNLVPSLLIQLEAFAEGRAHDRYLDLGLKPATALTDSDIGFMLENFFHAQRHRMIDVYPRYSELLARRGGTLPTPADRRSAAARFTVDDLRDLQIWQKLAWMDPIYLEHDARVSGLVRKGRQFSEDDKAALREAELELLNKVIPEYRDAALRGQIEISTSPFYHPILPLLCDTDIYKRTHPDSRMPRRPFVHPEDALEQLTKAVACHERLFGHKPAGLWPSEGSVSDAMVPLAADAGFRWMATDEQILGRTIGATFGRDGSGQVDQPERLYAPYAIAVGGARIACGFRDHALSDLIGFTYAGWPSDAAAEDFVGRLAEAGRRYRQRTGSAGGGGEARIFVILDGENAWEHFEGGGRPFLRALYRRLESHPELRAVTMSEACATPPAAELPSVFPGSWIDANFYIWIGHADDQQAWGQLADARDALDHAAGIEPAALAQAREEVLIAEGSDWFWWYGDDHSSAHDLEFDDLFRRHLRNAYRLLRKPIPDELFVSNISAGAPAPVETPPVALIAPTIDGEVTSYFEWVDAGFLEVTDTAGAMHRSDRAPSLVTSVRFGFDLTRLYVRIDFSRRVADLMAEGHEISLKFMRPEPVRFSVKEQAGRPHGEYWRRPAGGDTGAAGVPWVPRGPGQAVVGLGRVLEVALPFADLGATAGAALAFFVAVYDPHSTERERHPEHRPIELTTPDESFSARQWNA
jgi:alpha-amylase/alpha-mannosidase (GH57 family)